MASLAKFFGSVILLSYYSILTHIDNTIMVQSFIISPTFTCNTFQSRCILHLHSGASYVNRITSQKMMTSNQQPEGENDKRPIQSPENDNNKLILSNYVQNRRNIITSLLPSISILLTTTKQLSFVANASDDSVDGDLTSQMFNSDGSLKSATNGVTTITEATSRTISLNFPVGVSGDSTLNSEVIVSIDGSQPTKITSDDNVQNIITNDITYQLPDKWTDAPDYLDKLLSSQLKACDRIVVYQLPPTSSNILEKATTIGVANALGIKSIIANTNYASIFPKSILNADLVNGRKVKKSLPLKSTGATTTDGSGGSNSVQYYYEFDLAMAPDKCENSAENLGLGFCPYDTIVLFSATIVNNQMVVMAVISNKDEWKRSNADLKRVRESFTVL